MKKIVCDPSICCGCGSCINICPKKCISLSYNMNCSYAVINESICINCKQCERVCQALNPCKLDELNNVMNCLEGYSNNIQKHKKCASGAVGTSISENFIKEMDGYVAGVSSVDLNYYLTNDLEKLNEFCGSKYVKINTNNIYTQIKEKLKLGKAVLFIGTPCIIYGLKKFLKDDYPKLYTIDLICHGTPSPIVLNKFLLENRISNFNNIKFRTDTNYGISIDKCILNKKRMDDYCIAFTSGYSLTDNCYICMFANEKRIGDLSIGDSWGTKLKNTHTKYGTSLILVNNKKGNDMLEWIRKDFFLQNRDFKEAVICNSQLNLPVKKGFDNKYFFENFDKKTFHSLVKNLSKKMIVKQRLKKILIDLKLYSK